MSQNPYQSPQPSPPVIGVLSGAREDLYLIAVYQKGIMLCMLLYLAGVVVQPFVPEKFRLLVLAGVALVVIAGAALVFLLTTKVYPLGRGVLMGILTIIPCVGLIALLIVNQKAIRVLQENGVKVGLFGAKLSTI